MNSTSYNGKNKNHLKITIIWIPEGINKTETREKIIKEMSDNASQDCIGEATKGIT